MSDTNSVKKNRVLVLQHCHEEWLGNASDTNSVKKNRVLSCQTRGATTTPVHRFPLADAFMWEDWPRGSPTRLGSAWGGIFPSDGLYGLLKHGFSNPPLGEAAYGSDPRRSRCGQDNLCLVLPTLCSIGRIGCLLSAG